MENPTKIQMDDLGVPLFLETAISKKQKKTVSKFAISFFKPTEKKH